MGEQKEKGGVKSLKKFNGSLKNNIYRSDCMLLSVATKINLVSGKVSEKAGRVLTGRNGFVQQGLLWTLIAIAGIAALTVMGGAIKDKFEQLANTFKGTNP